jgi:CheY-like chemotaxis protein
MSKVMVVDDSIGVRRVVEGALAAEELEVVSVGSGNEAVERVEREHPDLVVCDVIMPDRDGYDVCRYIKSHPHLRRTPVLLISGTVNGSVLEQAAQARSDDVLLKPFDMNDLVRKVSTLLSISVSGDSMVPGAGGLPTAASGPIGERVPTPQACLVQLLTMPGVAWAALADREGYLIEAMGEVGEEAERAAALAATLAEAGERAGRDLARGAFHGMVLQYADGHVLVESAGPSAVLVLFVQAGVAPWEVRFHVKRALPELARATARPW